MEYVDCFFEEIAISLESFLRMTVGKELVNANPLIYKISIKKLFLSPVF